MGKRKFLALAFFVLFVPLIFLSGERRGRKEVPSFSGKPFVERLLSDFSLQYRLFKKSSLENGRFVYRSGNFTVVFTVDPELQRAVEREFTRFRVRYGAFVALSPYTGKVLAVFSSTDYPDLALKNTFPTASTFKIITASTALETGLADIDTELTCGGTADSCSPKVWLLSRYTVRRRMDIAFATSANPYFGNLGRLLGKERILEFAERFGFNRHDYGFPWGFLREPLDDNDLALLSAGLGEVRTSPFHEAFIAGVIENRGIAVKPALVERILENGHTVYTFKKEILGRIVSGDTARKIKEMMLLTVKRGTVAGRRYFRRFRMRFPDAVIGGKTGTLSELTYPEGRCEWFVGFVEDGDKALALSCLAVNGARYFITGYDLCAVIAGDFVKLNRKRTRGGRYVRVLQDSKGGTSRKEGIRG